ncbi:MAG TPA: PIN domain-containing protein [Dehalococcoidia bacterium]|nr:PIN domain-containing protein [Dehalococcoidia bacterium]
MDAPPRIFLDSSVLFAAAYSSSGSSRELILLHLQGRVVIVLSPTVLEETRRNLVGKGGASAEDVEVFLRGLGPEVVADADPAQVDACASYINRTDAVVLAAAMRARVACLVTWDRRHFIDDPQVALRSGLTILTPDAVLKAIRSGRTEFR